MRKKEIGSNFWMTHQQRESLKSLDGGIYGLDKWKHCQRTSSGRGAIKLLLSHLPQVKIALLPEYTCSSVIAPMEEMGVTCCYYPVNKDFTVDEKTLFDLIGKFSPQMVYFQSYYGFDTLKSIKRTYQSMQQKGIVVVEDITHSWLCDFNTTDADYSLASLRKWLEIPDGGVLLSDKHALDFDMNSEESAMIVSEFVKASEWKEKYFSTLDPSDKEKFRQHYVNAKDLLQQDTTIYRMSSMAQSVLAQTDFEQIVKRRRENAAFLQQNIKSDWVMACGVEFAPGATPLYYPIYVKGDRKKFQTELAEQDIYCPVHWPIPSQASQLISEEGMYIYSHVLSLICDQRYDEDDMKAIVQIINNYKE